MSTLQQDSIDREPTPRRVYIALVSSAVIWVAALLVVLQISRETAARHVPLKDSVQILLDLTTAHLWFEQVLIGDSDTTMTDVRQHLERADWYAQAIVGSGSTRVGGIRLADDEQLQFRLAAVRKGLSEFREMTERRWQQRGDAGPESGVHQAYDNAFRTLVAQAQSLKTAANEIVAKELRILNVLQWLLLLGVFLLAVCVTATFRRYVRRRHNVESALRESEDKFRTLYESSNDAVMLLTAESFFDCNEATLRIFRVADKKKFCLMHPADLSPPTQPDGTNSLELANKRIATAYREGANRFEWMHMRADGIEFPAEVLLSSVHIEGRHVLQAVVRDVTERKEAEERLRANEERLRTISQAALDAVIMMDAEGKAVHWNPAAQRMFGYEADEVIGKNIHQLLTPLRFREEAEEALMGFFRTGTGRAVGRILELEAARKTGEEFPIEISVAPIKADGQWSAVAVVRDITERKLAEESLRAEQTTLRRLLKSHDQERKLIAYEIHDGLAQKLVAAIMQCQAADLSIQDSDQASHSFHLLLDLLRQCLAETRRLISGVRPPILDEFGVVTAVQGLIEETDKQGGPQIEFRNDVDFHRLEPVLENTIYRIIQESLGNACRHSQSEKVLIELTHREDTIQVRVQDWGIGFAPKNVDDKRYGLAGIRERARLLGGHVLLDTAPGKGTCISVELPEEVSEVTDSE